LKSIVLLLRIVLLLLIVVMLVLLWMVLLVLLWMVLLLLLLVFGMGWLGRAERILGADLEAR